MNWSTCPRLQILWVWDVSRQFEHPTLSATGGQCHAQTVWNPGSFLVNICEMMFGICLTPEQTGIWSKHHLSFTLWVSKLRKDPKRKCRTQNLHGFVETPYLRNKPQATVPNAFWDRLWGWFLGPKQLLRRYLEHTRVHNQTSPSAHGLQSPHPRALGWLHILNTGPNITSFNCDKFVVFIMVWGSALGASRACV